VPDAQITFTGFPLPHSLLGGTSLEKLRKNLTARLVRLDPEGAFRSAYKDELKHFLGPLPDTADHPPHLVFAVGGAGAQTNLARQFLPNVAAAVRADRLRLTLVAGVRREVAAAFDEAIDDEHLDEKRGHGLDVLYAETHAEYFARFEKLLASADLLWTKPSELTFYAALGLPLLFCPPIGGHEAYNRRWALESGAGLKQRDPRHAAEWIADWLHDGTLAGAAWNGFMRLPKFGLYRILEAIEGEAAPALHVIPAESRRS
jgi:UDP-N-acetylglucosamine:LPS N-acetylglucosamine transferase